jgi:hypothetical protein
MYGTGATSNVVRKKLWDVCSQDCDISLGLTAFHEAYFQVLRPVERLVNIRFSDLVVSLFTELSDRSQPSA